MFKEDESRYTIFPIKDQKIWNFYKSSVSVFWTPEEITMNGDYQDFMSMSENERYFIKMILSFFASADGIVNENLVNRFSNEVQLAEARAVYSVQNFIETIHGETYSLLIDTYIKDKEEKLKCFNAIQEFECIRNKCMWGQKWITDKESSFATRLLAFILVEGLFFSGSFCAIFWLKKRGLMKGLTFSNELISRDEGLHTEFGIYLYNTYCDKIDKEDFYKMIKDAVEIETEFICESLPVRLIGMNHELMTIYIKFVADRICSQLKYDKIYNVQNPFQFMEMISVESKTNFFEKRVSEYSLASGGSRVFEINDDILF